MVFPGNPDLPVLLLHLVMLNCHLSLMNQKTVDARICVDRSGERLCDVEVASREVMVG